MDNTEGAKLALRDQLLTARGQLGVAAIGERARAAAEVLLATVEVRRAATVAAYVSVGREPGTGPLLDGLSDAGKRVLLPILQPDNDLSWAAYTGADGLARAGRGLLEPTSPDLGVDAVVGADTVIVPGLAVDHHGMRLGRGGGSYDRVLARLLPDTFVCCLVNSEEVLPQVPHASHDRRVNAVATQEGVRRFAGS